MTKLVLSREATAELTKLGQIILHAPTIDDVLKLVVNRAMHRTQASMVNIGWVIHDGIVVERVGQYPGDDAPKARHRSVQTRIGEGVVGSAIAAKKTVIIRDTRAEPSFVPIAIEAHSELVVPLIYDGKALGAINCEHTDANHFNEDHAKPLELLAAVAAARIAMLQTMRNLEETQHFLHDMLRTSPSVLYVLDYQSKLMIQGMDKFADFLGYELEDIQAMDEGVYSLVHPDDIPKVDEQENQLAQSSDSAVVPVECRLQQKNGEYLWVQISSKTFKRDAQGEPIMEVGSVQDISQLKAAERTLRDREARFKALFENCFDCIVLYDGSGEIQYTTPSIERFTGYSDAEVLGRNALEFVCEEDHKRSLEVWTDLVKRPGGFAVLEQRIRHKDGRVLWIEARLTNRIGDPNVNGIVSNFHDINERKDSEARIIRLADFDTLTGLPNRRKMTEVVFLAIEKAAKRNTTIALLYVDLDNFKNVNDTLGHATGDWLLNMAAHRMQHALPNSAQLARLGGDEFAVMLAEGDLALAQETAAAIVRMLQEPFLVDNYELSISASVGIAVYPDHGRDAETIFKHADIAMYEAKHQRNRYAVFREEVRLTIERSVQLEHDLQSALESDEFTLEFQPQLSLETGKATRLEALLRWRRNGEVYRAPSEFIPFAEKTGLIHRVGTKVIEQACHAVKALDRHGLDLLVAINISARELQRTDFVERLTAQVEAADIEPGSLEIEITETAAMSDYELSFSALSELRSLGFSIAIDDFGTGHSSLAYLRNLPADIIKIDQSFAPCLSKDASKDDLAFYRSLVRLTTSAGHTVVAEGIETPNQLNAAKELGIDMVQGFHICMPMPLEEFLQQKHGSIATA